MRRYLFAIASSIVICVIFLFALHTFTFSAECRPGFTYSSKEELESIRAECEKKVNDLRSQVNTLTAQVQFMDTQIYLTTLKIDSTKQKIEDTQKEIEILDEKIDGLDESLNQLSKVLLERIVEGYKTQSVSFLNVFLDSDNANDLINRVKYQKTTQDNNQKLLVQVQESKLNFEEQKKLREKKKAELDALEATLNKQKLELDGQKAQKQKLLADTRNDESTYQQILAQAQRQLSAFKSFVQTSGAGSVIGANAFGSGSDGTYYSQRDERWANRLIGYSSENILNVGCLLTSVAMVAKKNGQDVTPAQIAGEGSRFWANTAYMRLPWPGVAGKNYTNVSNIESELSQGNYVIVGVLNGSSNCSYGGDHFVVLTKKDGNDYIMHDPIYGPDKKFSSHYSTICSSATFK